MKKGEATLKDGSYYHIDVSGIGELIVQEEMGYPLKIHVLVSTGLGEGERVKSCYSTCWTSAS